MTTLEIDRPSSIAPPGGAGNLAAGILVQTERATGSSPVIAVEPVTIGVPLAKGVCADEAALRLSRRNGLPVPIQAQSLERWHDGSIRWVLLDFQHAGDCPRTEYVLTASGDAPVLPRHPIITTRAGDGIWVDTGAARWYVERSCFPFRKVMVEGRDVLDEESSGFTLDDGEGRRFVPRIETIELETAGPLRSVVRLSGVLQHEGRDLLELETELDFFAGLPTVRVALTLRNPRRAEHPGGFWELGDRGSFFIRDASLRLALRAAGGAPAMCCSLEPGAPFTMLTGPVEIYQDSSGGENWMSPVHVNREGRVPNSFCGYRLRAGGGEAHGRRTTPQLSICGDHASLSMAMRQFWQNFPKAMEADANALTLRLWPAQYADVHELQGGEQKTHDFALDFSHAGLNPAALAWVRQPSIAGVEAEWCASTGAIPFLQAAHHAEHPSHRRLVDCAIDGPDSFERKRETVDEFGWRHFGDLYADHESAFHTGETTFISHYNNQYDAVGGFATQFLQTGDPRWWRAMDELAAHVIDIDIYHARGDKAAYNGGLFWHTCHYMDAGRSTHRSYPHAAGTNGGGPGNEHNYSSGLALHYFLTGNAASRDAAIGLGRWVLAMDDGRKTPLAPVTSSATGLASATDTPDYHGPGRGAAYSIQSLLDAFRLTLDRGFLEKAEELIRRCIHPDDDVAARDLLDIEPKWSYTVFLQMLGRYLEFKRERGELDAMYAYARRSLLQYARWMADCEAPYLDKPDRLEFPNETWVAQDIRKSEAFDFAARHASEGEQQRFLERAAFFWQYVHETLWQMPTRVYTRPVVLMLGHGLLRSYMKRHPDERMPAPKADVAPAPRRPRFVTQKQRAKTRLMLAGALGGASVVLAAIALLLGR